MVRLVRKKIIDAGWLPARERFPTRFMYYGDYAQFLHRSLANPGEECECPDMPTLSAGEDQDQEAILYWEGAYYLMVYLLGWSNPAKGLHWLYSQEKNDADKPVLELLRAIYDSSGQLALLAAWFWEKRNTNSFVVRTDTTSFDPGHEWWQSFRRDFDSGQWRGWLPYGEGLNPLHLGHVLHTDVGRCAASWVQGDVATRQAALFIDGTGNWYEALCRAGRELTDLGGRSWHVHVVINQLGWLGMFRRSRTTGLWFQGKHSVHVEGN
jgi:hypothetical protein